MAGFGIGANHFTFTGENIYIVYDTLKDGYITVGADADGGVFEYQGVEGKQTFLGKEISVESTFLGILLTVYPKSNTKAGILSFTLILPIVNEELGVQYFQTLGIKKSDPIVSYGANTTYSVFPLFATAEMVPL